MVRGVIDFAPPILIIPFHARERLMGMMLTIAAGGALGAPARYWVMVRAGQLFGLGFPMGTMAVNIVGSFMLGVLIELMARKWSPGPEIRAFMVVGVIGSFTTFSTFSLDVVTLIERGVYWTLALYIVVSVAATVTAIFAGMALFRWILG